MRVKFQHILIMSNDLKDEVCIRILLSVDAILQRYVDVFQDEGHLDEKYKLEAYTSVEPTQCPKMRVPVVKL